ncbi:hypothetical protein BU17DRAFT_76670 [Hysterangium stoloniferum]|nr:hypothetical protein BU17DRAFT_76670 [Hysterangium stoloniferum]
MSAFTFGTELPDNVDKISAISDAQLILLSDLREMFKERVALEREYSIKLQLLAKKASEKKLRRMVKLVLGDEPTQIWTENTVNISTLDNGYSKLLSSLENIAQDHLVLADSLSSQVVDELKKLERRGEETKKKQSQFFERILADKEKTYDEECMEVESYRHKQERANDDRHADRAAKQLEQQRIDMLNEKNTYLISIAISNKTKNKLYEEDLPLLENSVQELLIKSLTVILQHSQSLVETHLDSARSRVASVQASLTQIDPIKDQDLFIEYNRSQAHFVIPNDAQFIPCEGFYDKGEISTDPAPKIFLQNKLSRCRAKLQELEPILSAKKSEVDKLQALVDAYVLDRTLGDLDAVAETHLDAQHQLISLSTAHAMLTAEVDIIMNSLGDDEGAQRHHTFKSSSFSIPTQCGYCKSSIWGLSKQGKTCKICHLSVHNKCELKVPAECPGANEKTHTRASASVTSTKIDSNQSDDEPQTPSSFVRPHSHDDSHDIATVLFDFEASSPFEISVSAGETVHLLEVNDGSGWIKVAGSQGNKGLIPASYVQIADDEGSDVRITSAFEPTSNGVLPVRALYNYDAQGPDEIPLVEGGLIELTPGPNGGKHYAEGWWEGIGPSGQKGIFPSNYVS